MISLLWIVIFIAVLGGINRLLNIVKRRKADAVVNTVITRVPHKCEEKGYQTAEHHLRKHTNGFKDRKVKLWDCNGCYYYSERALRRNGYILDYLDDDYPIFKRPHSPKNYNIGCKLLAVFEITLVVMLLYVCYAHHVCPKHRMYNGVCMTYYHGQWTTRAEFDKKYGNMSEFETIKNG